MNPFCDYLFDSYYAFKFLLASRNLGLSALKSHTRHLVTLRKNPKPASRTGMDALPCQVGLRGVYSKMVMVNMVFVGLGLAGPGWHGPATGHSIPCFSQMI